MFLLFEIKKRKNVPNSTPFDEGTFTGWFCVLCYALIPVVIYVALNTTLASFFMSTGLYFEASCNHYCRIFQNISEIADGRPPLTPKSKWKMAKLLIEAIRFHNRVKE